MSPLIGVVVVLAIITAGVAVRPSRVRHDRTTTMPSPSRIATAAHSWRQRKLIRRLPTALAVAEWCDEIARCVRSGASLRDALVSTAADDPAADHALSSIRLAIERGSSVADAVGRLDTSGPHLHLALSVIGTASRFGGASSVAIDRTAMALRQRAADLEERSAHAAQARLSTHVMTAVPLVMLGVLIVTDHDVRAVSTSGAGAMCIGLGLALNATGWWWMRRIVGAPG